MGYLRGVKEANTDEVANGDYRFSGEWEAAEDGNLRRAGTATGVGRARTTRGT